MELRSPNIEPFKCPPPIIMLTDLHKHIPPIVEINGTEQDPMLALPVCPLPAIPDDLPLEVEVPADLAGVFSVSGRQENSDRVISRGDRQFIVGCLVEFKGSGRGLLAQVCVEFTGRGTLFGGGDGGTQRQHRQRQ